MAKDTLPSELTLQILSYLAKSELATCRLTCKAFEATIRPQFYRTVSWDFDKLRGRKLLDLIGVLTSYTYAAGAHAEELEVSGSLPLLWLVGPLSFKDTKDDAHSSGTLARILSAFTKKPPKPPPEHHEGWPRKGRETPQSVAIRHLFRTFPQHLRNVRSVRWELTYSSAQYDSLLVEGLTELPLLVSFAIHSINDVSYLMPLDRFTTLESITLSGKSISFQNLLRLNVPIMLERNPKVVSLSLGYTHREFSLALDELIKPLETCTYLRGPLQELKILGFSAAVPEQSMMDLRRLTSLELNSHSRPNVRFSHTMLLAKLQAEQIHLQHLVIDVPSAALFSYLSSYSGLLSLTISRAGTEDATSSDVLANQFYSEVLPHHVSTLTRLSISATFEGRWCFGEHNAGPFGQCLGLRDLEVSLLFPECSWQKGMFFQSVALVLQSASQLPRLRTLQLLVARHEDERSALHGETVNRQKILKRALIHEIPLVDFCRPHSYPHEVVAAGKTFVLLDSISGGYRYTRIPSPEPLTKKSPVEDN
ncbi:hypothetical protein HGRIS_008669 [Hohenbuehelia grisea]|uniref:F-box domain-containing protein n=1 Tax=Hohenbuehelia grisea TaxID=104357 RepID=A0ABR3J964_9AGAR